MTRALVMPWPTHPPQPCYTGACRGDYWADSLSEDNSIRQAATMWKEDVGLRGSCGNCGGALAGCSCARTSTNSCGFPTTCPQPAGATDETIRCAGEWWVRNALSPDSAAGLGGSMEALSLRGAFVPGYELGLGASVDPFDSLTPAQQKWVLAALNDWLANTPGQCVALPSGADLTIPTNRVIAVICFQGWWNITGNPLNPAGVVIANGQAGVLTQDTLGSLATAMTVNPYAASSPGAYPSAPGPSPSPAAATTGMSTGTKVAIGVGAAAAVIATVLVVRRRKRAA